MNSLKLKSCCHPQSLASVSISSSAFGEQNRGKEGEEEERKKRKEVTIELGNESQLLYIPRLIGYEESWNWLSYLDSEIPWTRPTIRVFGRSCIQPRDTCYIASLGVSQLAYSGYQPRAYSWDDFPRLKDLLQIVHDALPGSCFNSLLLNRYNGGADYVGWHSDDEKLYGPTPEIASLSFGCERDFILKRKTNKLSRVEYRKSLIQTFGQAGQVEILRPQFSFLYNPPVRFEVSEKSGDEPAKKRLKKSNSSDQHSFTLKHGSLLVMRGYTQRDWTHSVPKRLKVDTKRINLTFRLVL